MRLLLGGLLVLSLALNVFLWSRFSSQSDQLTLAQASLNELDELRRQHQELQTNAATASDSAKGNARELVRLRSELAQLQRQARDATASRAQAGEVAQLQARLGAATQDLARAGRELADAVKLSPEELQQLKGEAQSIECVNNLKQIGIAAALWANAHQNVFPPDFISMKDGLETPKILFCPAAGATRVTEWSQLNLSLITYRYVNPGGNQNDPAKPVAICPVHGHVVLSDQSVHRR